MLRHLLLILFFTVFFGTANAQREYATCDSTNYVFNSDTTIVVGKKQLYYQTSAGLFPFTNFTTSDTAEYIRDFDVIRPDFWYTLVGSRYIGGPTFLYKSTDRGNNWVRDTSFYPATRFHPTSANFYYNSVNQLRHIGGDTIILFVGYYESGVVYSVDGGITWTEWFRNLITHYQGMFECSDYYYLYGFEGDAFRSWMFPFHKSLLFTPDTGGIWRMFSNLNHPNCSGTVNPDCVYVPPPANRCAQYNYLKNYADSVCPTLTVPFYSTSLGQNTTELFPNPSDGKFQIRLMFNGEFSIKIYDMLGREVPAIFSQQSKGTISVSLISPKNGLYSIVVRSASAVLVRSLNVQ